MDLWVYLDTLEQQIEERDRMLADFLTGYESKPQPDATGEP
jgi:tRNA A-37 threonylcarbamoyl transferase component Bud32